MGAFGRLSFKIEGCASEDFSMRKERRDINFALMNSERTVDLQKNSGKLEINLIRAPESGKDRCPCILYGSVWPSFLQNRGLRVGGFHDEERT